jgi:hypothetical protein
MSYQKKLKRKARNHSPQMRSAMETKLPSQATILMVAVTLSMAKIVNMALKDPKIQAGAANSNSSTLLNQ